MLGIQIWSSVRATRTLTHGAISPGTSSSSSFWDSERREKKNPKNKTSHNEESRKLHFYSDAVMMGSAILKEERKPSQGALTPTED